MRPLHIKETRDTLQFRELERREISFAADLAARAMRDNPPYVAIFGSDRSKRERGAKRFYRAVMGAMTKQPMAAYIDARLVGLLAADPPGTCMPSLAKQIQILPQLLRMGTPADLYRGLFFVRALKRNDLEESHWHVGPVAVEPELQGNGIGGQLMQEFCSKIDSKQEVAFLETEKTENVKFYERFGFKVVGEDGPLDVTQWYMRRSPSGAAE